MRVATRLVIRLLCRLLIGFLVKKNFVPTFFIYLKVYRTAYLGTQACGSCEPHPRLCGRGEVHTNTHASHARNAHTHTHSYSVRVIGTSIYIFLIIKNNGTTYSARDD